MTGFPTLPPIARNLPEAIELLEAELDSHTRRMLSQTTETRSGIVKLKTNGELSADIACREAVAEAISRVYGYRATASQLMSASYDRVDGARLRDDSAARVAEYRRRHAS